MRYDVILFTAICWMKRHVRWSHGKVVDVLIGESLLLPVRVKLLVP